MPRYHVLLVTLIAFLLTSCGSNSKTTAAPVAPVFTSTPVTQAVEAAAYTYQAVATGTAVTFALTNAPAGATLNGNTISWTPSAQQARTQNNFTITAIASGGPSTTQSWTVTPSGTIRVSHVDTLWNQNGSIQKPFDWSGISSYVAALVPQADGSFQSLSGTAGANGMFEIPNVPAGYYWLKLGPRDTYWTSSSSFDVGNDYVVSPAATVPTTSTTSINFSLTALDPTPISGLLQFDSYEALPLPYSGLTIPGSTTFSGGFGIGTNLDFSIVKTGFLSQYEQAALGAMNGYVMGPELTLSNLSLTTGAPNTISGTLNPKVPASINLSVKGSAWAPLFNHIAPTAPTAPIGGFYLSVQPYVLTDNPNVTGSKPIDLIWLKGNSFFPFRNPTCPSLSLNTDVEAGTVSYSDPFPSNWRRIFVVCQSASVDLPLPGGATQTISLSNMQMTTPPTAPVKPLLSAVQNPKINGADLFTAASINSKAVTLSWDPPAIGTPFGYTVEILSPTTSTTSTFPAGASPGTIAGTVSTFPVGTSTGTIVGTIGTFPVGFLSAARLSTAKNSMTIPPNLLPSGKTYLFLITAVVDGKANMETSPHRSLLPTASAQLLSAPITVTN